MEINEILQNLIYMFNDNHIRDKIIKNYIIQTKQKQFIWKGTILLNNKKKFNEYQSWKLSNNKIYLFTVGYIYNGNMIHYVAFMLNVKNKHITCFDPGYNLYLYGKHKIIPLVINELHKQNIISDTIILRAGCIKKHFNMNYGLQFNGKSPYKNILPADAFCQTWTLYFIMSCILQHGDSSFFDSWCKIKPSLREFFLIQSFILPQLELLKTYPIENIRLLKYFIQEQYWTRI